MFMSKHIMQVSKDIDQGIKWQISEIIWIKVNWQPQNVCILLSFKTENILTKICRNFASAMEADI